MNRNGIIALMITLACLFSACVGPGGTSTVSEGETSETSTVKEYGEFETAFRFLVTSDTHISSTSSTEAARLKKLFTSSYAYAETQDYKKVDALVVVGDMTNSGYDYELKAFMDTINSAIREETTLITVMGNHEYYGGGQKPYQECVDENLDKHVVVNGYHFIGLSPYNGSDYSSEQINWLGKELADAAAADPDKPIITFQHHHIKDTVYVSAEWYTYSSAALNEKYSQYSQILNFSGHSHGPVNNPTSAWQTDYSLFGTGTLSYFEMTTGMTYGTIPPKASDAAQFYIVEVSVDNRVRVMPYNLLTDDFFRTPSQLDGDAQLIYEINDLKDKSTWKYTSARIDADADPYFDDGAAITVGTVTSNSAVITIPQALDDTCVYSYDIVFTPAEGSAVTFKYFSEYYFEPMPETMTYTLTGLNDGTEYKVDVYPVDCYGHKGKAISTTLTTAVAEKFEYESVNDVNYLGTFTNFDSLSAIKFSPTTFAYGGKIGGDVFTGDWCTSASNTGCKAELTASGGYNDSAALAVWSTNKDNQGLYVFATEDNGNTTKYPSAKYLRVWVDFSDIDFRKACFGLVTPTGELYDTDDADGRSDQKFMYLAEGSTEWKTYYHGGDGCFGSAQASSVKGFVGWLAFPVGDFVYRAGTGTSGTAGTSYGGNEIAGIYMFWDYDDSISAGTKFMLDEFQFVEDYTVFEEYSK